MAAQRMGKSALLVLALCATLSLPGAEAQNNCTYSGTPGWAIAEIVMLALLLASLLCSCCLAPLCSGMCKGGNDGCQTGISFGK